MFESIPIGDTIFMKVSFIFYTFFSFSFFLFFFFFFLICGIENAFIPIGLTQILNLSLFN